MEDQSQIKQMVTHAIRNRKLSMGDFKKLTDSIMADGIISEDETKLIKKLQDKVQAGEIKIEG